MSVIPWDSFAAVFPVHGHISIRSSGYVGPSFSASVIVHMGSLPHIAAVFSRIIAELPNLVSVCAALNEKTGTISYSPRSSFMTSSAALCVQNEPHTANPSFFFGVLIVSRFPPSFQFFGYDTTDHSADYLPGSLGRDLSRKRRQADCADTHPLGGF